MIWPHGRAVACIMPLQDLQLHGQLLRAPAGPLRHFCTGNWLSCMCKRVDVCVCVVPVAASRVSCPALHFPGPQRRQANGPETPSNGSGQWSSRNRHQGWGGEPLANNMATGDGPVVREGGCLRCCVGMRWWLVGAWQCLGGLCCRTRPRIDDVNSQC